VAVDAGTASEPRSLPTAPPQSDQRHVRRRRGLRRLFFCALTAFLVLGALGFFGPRDASVSASAGGWALDVTYPRVSRPGLSTGLQIEVRHEGGFETPVTVTVASSYFDVLDESSIEPEPAQSTTDGSHTIWTFDPPTDGDTLSISVGGRIQPGAPLRRPSGTAAVLSEGRPAASVRWKTFVTP
jgi:hypothetical protein